jgi:hypothetical protein
MLPVEYATSAACSDLSYFFKELEDAHGIVLGEEVVDAVLRQPTGPLPHCLEAANVELRLAHRVFVARESVEIDVSLEVRLLEPSNEFERHERVYGPEHEAILGC